MINVVKRTQSLRYEICGGRKGPVCAKCYLEFNISTRTVRAFHEFEKVDGIEHQKIRWLLDGVVCLHRVNELLTRVGELAEDALAESEIDRTCIEEIGRLCRVYSAEKDWQEDVWTAENWFGCDGPVAACEDLGLTANTTDEELEALVKERVDVLPLEEGVYVKGALGYFKELRDELREAAAECAADEDEDEDDEDPCEDCDEDDPEVCKPCSAQVNGSTKWVDEKSEEEA